MKNATAQQLIDFEQRIKGIFAEGELPFLIHLCGGNETQLIEIFEEVHEGDWVLCSHRNHYHALLSGMDRAALEQKIREGNSMFVFARKGNHGCQVNFMTSAILGGMCGIAAGLALDLQRSGNRRKVWCFLGDGAADNGHLYEAALFVETRELPCTFIIEDNDRSVDATKIERRGPRPTCPWADFDCVKTYGYSPSFPHGGAGLTTMIEFKPGAVQRYLQRNV